MIIYGWIKKITQFVTVKFVNETCVDTNKCKIIWVLLLTDEIDMVERIVK